ncbi:hypothetical protein MXB_815 [Myxobolus squamalis]|nr:hypothetical protein MXB_815 [Myxobolus squamalis]
MARETNLSRMFKDCGFYLLFKGLHFFPDMAWGLDGISSEFVYQGLDIALSIFIMNLKVFIDVTFRIMPTIFYQCLILIAYDRTINTHVPHCLGVYNI